MELTLLRIHSSSPRFPVTIMPPNTDNWLILSFCRINWDIFMLILLLINMIVIPLDVAFFASKQDTFWVVFNVFTDLAFVLDIALNFRTGE